MDSKSPFKIAIARAFRYSCEYLGLPLEVGDILDLESLTKGIGKVANKHTAINHVLLVHCFHGHELVVLFYAFLFIVHQKLQDRLGLLIIGPPKLLYPFLSNFPAWNVGVNPKHCFDLVVNDK